MCKHQGETEGGMLLVSSVLLTLITSNRLSVTIMLFYRHSVTVNLTVSEMKKELVEKFDIESVPQ